jgi:uncharacterized protein YbjT (DUF2867 family)
MHLIVGASGQLGRRVAGRLLESSEPVRMVSRSPDGLRDFSERGAEVVRGDLLEEAWIEGALAGVRSVVLAAHGLVPPSRRNHPAKVDRAGVGRLVHAAGQAGVEHIVYISAAGAGRAKAAFYAEKRAGEARVKASGAAWTILRPTVFMENHALLLLAEPLLRTGRVTLFGRGATPLNWISAEDLADEVVRALQEEGHRGTVREIGGPRVLSRIEALQIVESRLGRTAKRRHVPLLAVRLMKALMGPFHPGMRYLLELVVEEETRPEDIPTDPGRFHWTGSRTLEEVVDRWREEIER